jgi:hypothetical protein
VITGAARILHEYLQVKDGQFKKSFNLNQWDEWLPQGGIVLKLLTGITVGIVM